MRQSIVKLPGQVSEADLNGYLARQVSIRLNNQAELRGELFLGRNQELQEVMQAPRRFLPFKGLDGRLRSISMDMVDHIEEA